MTKRLIRFLLIIKSFFSIAQKHLQVKYISEEITIDGILDEKSWEKATRASDFWQYFPKDTIQAKSQTYISMTYDNQELYIRIKVYSGNINYE